MDDLQSKVETLFRVAEHDQIQNHEKFQQIDQSNQDSFQNIKQLLTEITSSLNHLSKLLESRARNNGSSSEVQTQQSNLQITSDLHQMMATPPKSVRFEIPRFDGNDTIQWICKAEEFFDFYEVFDVYRLKIAAIHFDGPVVPWFQKLQQSGSFLSWALLKNAILAAVNEDAFCFQPQEDVVLDCIQEPATMVDQALESRNASQLFDEMPESNPGATELLEGKALIEDTDMPVVMMQPWAMSSASQVESVAGLISNDGSGSWLVNPATITNQILIDMNGQKILGFEDLQHPNNGNVGNGDRSPSDVAVHHVTHKKKGSSIADDAWRLLQDFVVYYCSSHVGIIVANDPFAVSVMYFDQSWKKTMNCYSPGQGLMPANFMVRIVQLGEDGSVTAEVLDPDFGEGTIGQVALVDSGLWILLLPAYGKCSGDLSVQERIDVHIGIMMILKLCLADGFDISPTLLVADGSFMIDGPGWHCERAKLFDLAMVSGKVYDGGGFMNIKGGFIAGQPDGSVVCLFQLVWVTMSIEADEDWRSYLQDDEMNNQMVKVHHGDDTFEVSPKDNERFTVSWNTKLGTDFKCLEKMHHVSQFVGHQILAFNSIINGWKQELYSDIIPWKPGSLTTLLLTMRSPIKVDVMVHGAADIEEGPVVLVDDPTESEDMVDKVLEYVTVAAEKGEQILESCALVIVVPGEPQMKNDIELGIAIALMDMYGWFDTLLESHRLLAVMDQRDAIYWKPIMRSPGEVQGSYIAEAIIKQVALNLSVNGFANDGWSLLGGDGVEDVTIVMNSSSSKLLGWHVNASALCSILGGGILYAKASMLLHKIPPVLLVPFLKEPCSDWADFGIDVYSAASLRASLYAVPSTRATAVFGGQVILPLAHALEHELLEMIRIEGHGFAQDDVLARDMYLLQLCSGVDENSAGACAQLVSVPTDESFADDAPLLPSGFCVISMNPKTEVSSATWTLDLTSTLRFTYESHLRENVAAMALQYVRRVVASVQRVAMAIEPSRPGSHIGTKHPSGSSETLTLARWISHSYRSHTGIELLWAASRIGDSLLKLRWHHSDAIMCCSLKASPVLSFANQAGLDMLEAHYTFTISSWTLRARSLLGRGNVTISLWNTYPEELENLIPRHAQPRQAERSFKKGEAVSEGGIEVVNCFGPELSRERTEIGTTAVG